VSTPVTEEEVQRCAREKRAHLLTFDTSDVQRRGEKDGDLFARLGTH